MNKVQDYNRFLKYKNRKLFLEDMSMEKLANNFQTPSYCYSVSEIEFNFRLLENSFKRIKPLICYAMKANFNSEIIRILSKMGSGIDVVSSGELNKSLLNRVDPNKIVFSGVGKTSNEIELALRKNIKQINVESIEELEEIGLICRKQKKKINICLRVNPDINAKTHEKISTGRSEDKFGIPDKEIPKVFKKYKNNKFINIIGLSVHIGSQIESLSPFKSAFKKIKDQIIFLNKEGFKISLIDLGGGIGIRYNEKNKLIDIKMYAKLVEDLFAELGVEIIIEPGRSLVGSSGIILSRVIRVKKGKNKNFLIIDAGMNNLIRPALYGAFHNIIPVELSKGKKIESYDIVGPICETGDVFGKNVKTQEFKKDDLVAICSAGAYSSCMASKYNLRGEVNEIFIKKKKINISNK